MYYTRLSLHRSNIPGFNRDQLHGCTRLRLKPLHSARSKLVTLSSSSSGYEDTQRSNSNPSQPPLRHQAVALPQTLQPSAGGFFCMAGFLKIWLMCFNSQIAIAVRQWSGADLTLSNSLFMFIFGIILVAVAKTIVDKRLEMNRWVQLGVVAGSVAMLILARWWAVSSFRYREMEKRKGNTPEAASVDPEVMAGRRLMMKRQQQQNNSSSYKVKR